MGTLKPASGLQYITDSAQRDLRDGVLCQIHLEGTLIELMGNFAIHTPREEKDPFRTDSHDQ